MQGSTNETLVQREAASFNEDFRYAWPTALGHSLRIHTETQEEAARLCAVMRELQTHLSMVMLPATQSDMAFAQIREKLTEIHEGQATQFAALLAAMEGHIRRVEQNLHAQHQHKQSAHLEEMQMQLLYTTQQQADAHLAQAELESGRQYAKAEEVITTLKESGQRLERLALQLASDQRDRAAEQQLLLQLQRSTVWQRLRWLIGGDFKTAPSPKPRLSKAA